MKTKFLITSFCTVSIITLLTTMVLITGCKKDKDDDDDSQEPTTEEIVAIANRNSSSLSFINVETDEVSSTLSIANAEPMYLVYVPSNDKLYVGDRANNKVHQIDPATRKVEQSIDVGQGVFHMWAGGDGKQLWVNNDVDFTTSVIDLSDNTIAATINIGVKPHDVFVTKDGRSAYVSVFSGVETVPDSIFMYSTANFSKTGSVAVGKDPHLFHSNGTNDLFVPCQSGQVYVLDGNNLAIKANQSFEGAHGIFQSPNEKFVFVADITGEQLYTINSTTYSGIGDAVSSLGAKPHNLAVIESGKKLYVTHSGATANTVSTYTISDNGILASVQSITAETNPFGLAYYKRNL